MNTSDWLIWQLADSAFPTGGFAHSWGLEAAWQSGEVADALTLRRFVHELVYQTARGTLPFLTAAHRDPSRLDDLDVQNDLFLTNVVANRASRRQGRAFVTTCARIWASPEMTALADGLSRRQGHCAPQMGAALRSLAVPMDLAQRLFMFGTVRGALAAAVRLGISGSYQAQQLQHDCGGLLDEAIASYGNLDDRDAAQTAPILDVIQASHDRLYSRLFQS
jgi:urease accessory protein